MRTIKQKTCHFLFRFTLSISPRGGGAMGWGQGEPAPHKCMCLVGGERVGPKMKIRILYTQSLVHNPLPPLRPPNIHNVFFKQHPTPPPQQQKTFTFTS